MKAFMIICLWVLLAPAQAGAEWAAISATLPETDIRWVAIDPAAPRTMYAATARQVYRTGDDGASWRQVCTVWSERDVVRSVSVDPVAAGTVYVASDSGVWRSQDAGETWKPFYQGISGRAKSVRCIAHDASDTKKIWLGTTHGLVTVDSASGRAAKVAGFPSVPVQAIWTGAVQERQMHAAAGDGLYESRDGGVRWKRIAAASDGEDGAAQQMDIEEMPAALMAATIIHQPAMGKLFAATSSGLYGTAAGDVSWRRIGGRSPQGLKVHYLARSPQSFYAATNRGVYRWDPALSMFRDISQGLPSRSVSMVAYDTASGALVAATKKGVHRMLSPELVDGTADAGTAEAQSVDGVLSAFDGEPTVQEVQMAAIEYAEVHPKKIRRWRDAAARKAWLPTVSFNQGFDRNENVDLDRGGTADPDRFIQGPPEKSYDWSVSASWDLGELVWNGDQTSIDTRSKLMTELRNDVLNAVTHLYYERRRLQVEAALRPPASLAARIEKRLRLDELTADIDALTGGYLSSRLGGYAGSIA